MSTIYNTTNEMAYISERLETEDDAKVVEQLQRLLNEADGRSLETIDDLVGAIRGLDRMSGQRTEAAKQMSEMAAADARRSRRLKDELIRHLEQTGQKKVATPRFSISLKKAPGKVEVLIPPSNLPAYFQRLKPEADKTKIKAALKEGAAIQGCSFKDGGNSVVIKG